MVANEITSLIKFLNEHSYGGHLKFFGDWFGLRPDSFHYVHEAYFIKSENVIRINFKDGEEVTIQSPSIITFSDYKVSVKYAKKVRIAWESFNDKADKTIYFDEYIYSPQQIIVNSNLNHDHNVVVTEAAFEIVKKLW